MKIAPPVTRLSNILSRFKKSDGLRITIIGAFGARNVGDLAIMKTIVNDLSGDPQIAYRFASRDEVLKNFYKVPIVNPFSFRGLLKLLRDDAIVIGGGGLYGHETHRYLVTMLPLLRILKTFRKKLIFYNVGIYDAESSVVLNKLWPVLRRADEIFLRDDSDLEIIPEDIKNRAKVEPDITHQLEPKEPPKPDFRRTVDKCDRLVGLSLRYTNVKQIGNGQDARIARIVVEVIEQQFLEKGIPVLFIPFQPIDSDYFRQYFANTTRKFPDTFTMLDTDKLTVEEIKWVVSKLGLAIGMRLHFQIFSRDTGVPVIGLSYAPKCENFLKKSGCRAIDVYNMDINSLNHAIETTEIPFLKNVTHHTRRELETK